MTPHGHPPVAGPHHRHRHRWREPRSWLAAAAPQTAESLPLRLGDRHAHHLPHVDGAVDRQRQVRTLSRTMAFTHASLHCPMLSWAAAIMNNLNFIVNGALAGTCLISVFVTYPLSVQHTQERVGWIIDFVMFRGSGLNRIITLHSVLTFRHHGCITGMKISSTAPTPLPPF